MFGRRQQPTPEELEAILKGVPQPDKTPKHDTHASIEELDDRYLIHGIDMPNRFNNGSIALSKWPLMGGLSYLYNQWMMGFELTNVPKHPGQKWEIPSLPEYKELFRWLCDHKKIPADQKMTKEILSTLATAMLDEGIITNTVIHYQKRHRFETIRKWIGKEKYYDTITHNDRSNARYSTTIISSPQNCNEEHRRKVRFLTGHNDFEELIMSTLQCTVHYSFHERDAAIDIPVRLSLSPIQLYVEAPHNLDLVNKSLGMQFYKTREDCVRT